MVSSQIKELPLDVLMPLIREKLDQGLSVKLSPRGVSMLPLIRQGKDSVLLSPLPEKLKKYDLPLYRRDDGKYVLHRIVKAGESYTCVGDNQFQLENGLRHDQMIALVTVLYRNGREISVDAPIYRMYCVFWHVSRPLRRFWRRGCGFVKRRVQRIFH